MSRAPTLSLKIAYDNVPAGYPQSGHPAGQRLAARKGGEALHTSYGDDDRLKVDVHDPVWNACDKIAIRMVDGEAAAPRNSPATILRIGSFSVDLASLEETPLQIVSRHRKKWEDLESSIAPMVAETLNLPEPGKHRTLAEIVEEKHLPHQYALLASKPNPEEDPEWERFEHHLVRQIDSAQIKKEGPVDLPTRRLLREIQRSSEWRPKYWVETEKCDRSRYSGITGTLIVHILFLVCKEKLRRDTTAVIDMPEDFIAVESGDSRPLPFDEIHDLTFNSDQAAKGVLNGTFEGAQVYDEGFDDLDELNAEEAEERHHEEDAAKREHSSVNGEDSGKHHHHRSERKSSPQKGHR